MPCSAARRHSATLSWMSVCSQEFWQYSVHFFFISNEEFSSQSHVAGKHFCQCHCLLFVSLSGQQCLLHMNVHVQHGDSHITIQTQTLCLCVLLSSLRLTQQTVRRKKRKRWKGRKKVWCREQSDGYSLSEEKRKPERKITEKRSSRRNRPTVTSLHPPTAQRYPSVSDCQDWLSALWFRCCTH